MVSPFGELVDITLRILVLTTTHAPPLTSIYLRTQLA